MKNKKYIEILKYIIIAYASIKIIDIIEITVMNIPSVIKHTSAFFAKVASAFSAAAAGFIIAYILDPFVGFICSKTRIKSRLAGTLISYLIIVMIISGIVSFTVMKINSMGGTSIGENIILIINRSVDEFINGCIELTRFISLKGFSGISSDILSEITYYTTRFIRYIGRSFTDIVSAAGTVTVKMFIGFVIAFYFLKDKEKIKKNTDKVMSVIFPSLYVKIKAVLRDIHIIFSGYFKGQLTDSLILSAIISTALTLLGIRFALPIGIISGFLNIIPYIGAITGFILAVIAGIISGSLKKAVFAGIVMIAVQQIDSVFLSPRIVGKSVNLNPAAVIVLLVASGSLFGIAGMFFAVPAGAIIKHIFIKYYYEKKLAKNNTSE